MSSLEGQVSAQACAARAGNGAARAVGAGIHCGFQIQLTVELLCGEERVRGKGAADSWPAAEGGGERGNWVLVVGCVSS